MINILLNRSDINAEWCFSEFQRYIKSENKVVIIPFSFREDRINSNESWKLYYGEKEGKYYNDIINSFFSMEFNLKT